MVDTLEALDEMIAIVEGKAEGKTWIKDEDVRPVWTENGPTVMGMCLGAMMSHLIMERDEIKSLPSFLPILTSTTLWNAVGEVIVEQYPDRVRYLGGVNPPHSAIVPFNDHPDTTADDVVRVLEKAKVRVAEAA